MLGQDKENLLRFRRTVRALVSEKVPEGRKVDDVLGGLAEKWNPLFDSVGKQNLVEDVNALVRDFLRPIRASFQRSLPDSKRIGALAEQLSASKGLTRIVKREPLKRYIELYILRCLSEI